MIWPFRKQKYKVCEKCGVHFEAISYSDPRWENLCETHRDPVRNLARKKDSVIAWASVNFERLYDLMEKERMATEEQSRQMFQAQAQAQYSNLQNCSNQYQQFGWQGNAP